MFLFCVSKQQNQRHIFICCWADLISEFQEGRLHLHSASSVWDVWCLKKNSSREKQEFIFRNNPLLFNFSPQSWQICTCPSTKSKQPTGIPLCLWIHLELRTGLIHWPSWAEKWAEVTLWPQQASNVSRNICNSHGIHVAFKHQLECCRSSCCKLFFFCCCFLD